MLGHANTNCCSLWLRTRNTFYKGNNIITVLCRWHGDRHKRHVTLWDTWTHFEHSIIVYVQRRLLSSVTVNSFHLVVCLTTGPKPLPKRALHILRSRASSIKWEYPLLSLKSSNSFLRLLPCLPVTSISPCIFPSITRCRRQFLRKMWPIQCAFRLRISCRMFLYSLTLSNTSSFLTWSVQLIFSILLQHHISKLSRCFWSTVRSVQVSAPYKAMLQM